MSSLSREFLLTAACCVWPPTESRTAKIYAAAAGPIDWELFFRVVMRHRVVGLVHDGLTRARPNVPTNVALKVAEEATKLARQNLELTAEAVRLQRLFAAADIPVAFIKGVSLARLAYGNLGIRHGKDLDLVVAPDAFPEAALMIEDAGYRRFDPPAEISDAQLRILMPMRKDLGYIHKQNQIELELHWRLFLNAHVIQETSFMTSSRVVSVSETLGLHTLGEDDLFAYLCAHGALHRWYQLKWLADIGALLRNGSIDDVERLYRAAEARGVGRAAAQALLLCYRLLGTAIPNQLLASFRAKPTVRWLERTALNAMTAGNSEIEPRDMLFGTTGSSLSAFLLGHNWRYYLAELKIHATCEADILAISLPNQFQFLYPMLRLPLWLWRHRFLRRTAMNG